MSKSPINGRKAAAMPTAAPTKVTLPKRQRGASILGSAQQDSIRYKIIWGLILLGFIALIARAFYVQVLNKDYFQEQGNKLITTTRKEPSYRGMITDRNHMPLAVSAPLITLTFSPYDYANTYYDLKKQQILMQRNAKMLARINKRLEGMDLNQLATLASIPVETLKNATKINDSIDVRNPETVKAALPTGAGSHYMMLMERVTPEVAQPILDLDFAGIQSSTFYQRYYPQAQPNAQLLGFMANSQKDGEERYQGRSGIERLYEDILAGKDGKVMVMKDAKNNSLKEIQQISPEVPGKNLQLTVDSRLQYILYNELENIVRVQSARWATGIIVDVQTGEVLALSNWPSYNPNDLNSITNENQRNHALIDMFEPGSVMKPFTVATGLKSGQYSVNSMINTSPGSLEVGGYTIHDHANLGTISLRTLLQQSSNVGSAKIALSLPPSTLSDTQKAFGFGKKTALNFPGEAAGNIPTPAVGETSRRATVAYGYGLQVTLAQLAQAYATLGAGGALHPLTLVKSTQENNDSDSNAVIVPFKPAEPTQVMKQKDALAIVDMLKSVTEKGGTATLAAIDGYYVAGKTGTARRIKPTGGYFDDQYRTTFVGIAPASNPRLVIGIMVEDPRLQKFGGLVAAPVFHNVMKEALRLYNVPYDKPLTGKENEKATAESANDL